MCGIAGIINYQNPNPDKALIEPMLDVMEHRGPDGRGSYVDKYVLFGHVRLAIIDVVASKQPMCNEDKTVWITFNGEIYNYQQIRKDLIAKGHKFVTKGDTETLVHLYEEFGEGMVNQLQGMFAFAIWDKKQSKLFIARDRLGIKPVYYSYKNGTFIFASEPKAILEHPEFTTGPDSEGLWHYLTYRSVPSPGTLFKGINRLKQGHTLTLTENGLSEKCYWDIKLIAESDKDNTQKTPIENIEQAESLLLTSVRRRLISDVPLGAFLSGGVDSSLIVAMMAKISNAPVRTYSVGFENFASSELPYANTVAKLLKTDHCPVVLKENDFAELLEKLTWMRDSPLSERSDIPLFVLAAEARKDIKVLLSGEGSDELYAGYPKYAYDKYSSFIGLFPKSAIALGARLLPGKFRRVEIALRSLGIRDEADRWAQWFATFTSEEKNRLMHLNTEPVNPTLQYIFNPDGYTNLDRMLYSDCKIWLCDNLLERADRMTMATSVESRVPFLDHEFVELAFKMPKNMKVQGKTGKWLIKQLALKYLTKEIVYRRKVGFEVPLAQWFRGKLKDMCYDRICERNGLAGDIFDRAELENILDEHCSGKKDNFLKIWTLLGISIWYDLFCSGKKYNFNS